MENHKIKIIETYVYYIDVKAIDGKEALKQAKIYYENEEDGVTGIANYSSFEGVKYKLVK